MKEVGTSIVQLLMHYPDNWNYKKNEFDFWNFMES